MEHEVFPALGCTEPSAVSYCAALAGEQVGREPREISIIVDPGVYKNGYGVTVPNTGGRKGNLIAGVLGALIARPDLEMEILDGGTPGLVKKAGEIIESGRAAISFDRSKTDLYIEVLIKTDSDTARAVIRGAHTNLVRLEKNDEVVLEEDAGQGSSPGQEYKAALRDMKIADMIDLARAADEEDCDYIRRGVDMNLEISEKGRTLEQVGFYVSDLVKKGYLLDDVFSTSKILTASAADARMAGLSMPVMSSGGSGNQGIIAILVPWNVGRYFDIDEKKVIQSIALSHLVNSYIKCYTGDLSPLCGCAIAAGVGAAVAIVFQQCGDDMEKITLAVNNLISDLGGMLCDGAKGGCALKVASSTDSAIRSAYMAINGHGITQEEGFVGRTAEETILNLSEIGRLGMAKVDDTMLDIMIDKAQ
jgi:L-cysteine desulfidase